MRAAVMERGRPPAQREDGHEVEDDERGKRGERAEDEGAGVAFENRQHGDALAVALREDALKSRRLGEAEAHVEADEDEQRAGEKGEPPAKGQEGGLAQVVREEQEDAGGAEEAERRAELWEHAVPGAPMR